MALSGQLRLAQLKRRARRPSGERPSFGSSDRSEIFQRLQEGGGGERPEIFTRRQAPTDSDSSTSIFRRGAFARPGGPDGQPTKADDLASEIQRRRRRYTTSTSSQRSAFERRLRGS